MRSIGRLSRAARAVHTATRRLGAGSLGTLFVPWAFPHRREAPQSRSKLTGETQSFALRHPAKTILAGSEIRSADQQVPPGLGSAARRRLRRIIYAPGWKRDDMRLWYGQNVICISKLM